MGSQGVGYDWVTELNWICIFIPAGTYFVFSICHILLYICVQSLIHVWCSETPWTVACQTPLSMGFSRQEYCSILQGLFQTQGLNPCLQCLLHWQVDYLPLSHLGNPKLIITIVLSFLFLDKGWMISDFPFYSFEGYNLWLCIPKCMTRLPIIAFFKY